MNIENILSSLTNVPGVKAIALGGSRSRNEADALSDYDVGVYYEAGFLDIAALESSLSALDDDHREGILNAPGQWGPWINGGAWLTVNGKPVDIMLRDLTRVKAVLSDCLAGRITIDYQCGHPFGFVNSIYAAETHFCKPLWQDESKHLDALKALLYTDGIYSPIMRDVIIKKFLWEAWFSLACSRKASFKGDFNYSMGSVFRAVCSWVQVLYAMNNKYLMNEKGALKQVVQLKKRPVDMEVLIQDAYKHLLDKNAEKAYKILDALHSEIESLAVDKTVIRQDQDGDSNY